MWPSPGWGQCAEMGGRRGPGHPMAAGAVHLHWVEDGLQCGQHVTEEEVPRLCQRVQQFLSCGHRERSLLSPPRLESSLPSAREPRARLWAPEVPSPPPMLTAHSP